MNSNELAKLQEQVGIRFRRLDRNLEAHRAILDAAKRGEELELRDLSALAFMLQSFYTEIESIFKRVALVVDAQLLDKDSWHRDLLASMATETPSRRAAISRESGAVLRKYLSFRHFSRHATAVDLDWNQMAPLVLGCEAALQQVRSELDAFVRGLKADDR